jgi:hypothetical protein
MFRPATLLIAFAATALLVGCDALGIETGTQLAAKREAEGKAVGGACRHAGRAIEDCYTLNRKTEKASVYAGWREMDDYMRENKLDPVPAQLSPRTVANAQDSAGDEHEPAPGKDAQRPAPRGASMEPAAPRGASTEPAAPRGAAMEPAAPRGAAMEPAVQAEPAGKAGAAHAKTEAAHGKAEGPPVKAEAPSAKHES